MVGSGCVIAIVDDDEIVRRALTRLVQSLSYEAAAFASGEAFLAGVAQATPTCALLDLHMPGLDGLEVLQVMRTRKLGIPTIVITGNPEPPMRDRCMEAGAVDYLQKPLDRELVFASIREVLGE